VRDTVDAVIGRHPVISRGSSGDLAMPGITAYKKTCFMIDVDVERCADVKQLVMCYRCGSLWC